MKRLLFFALLGLFSVGMHAQRVADQLSRGLIAIPQGDKTGQDDRYGMSGAPGKVTNEKTLNLRYALAFGRIIEQNCPDVKVIYTRSLSDEGGE